MIKHGSAPFLECSSKGDSRFSAFNARIRGRYNESIEKIYQGSKIFEQGNGFTRNLSWREAKGRKPVNARACATLYSKLWDEYIDENPDLLIVLKKASGLSDIFGQVGHCCQATELWRIRNEK